MHTLLALTIVVGAPQLKERPDEGVSIQGRWVAQSVVVNGQPSGQMQVLEYEFTSKGDWIIYVQNKVLAGTRTYTANPKTKPASIDLSEREDGFAYPGIFKIKGDTLTLTFRFEKGERPAGFDDPPAQLMTFVMTRLKSK